MMFRVAWSDQEAPAVEFLDIRVQDDYDENEEGWDDDLDDDDWDDDDWDEDEEEEEDDDWDDEDDDEWDDEGPDDGLDARRGGRLDWN